MMAPAYENDKALIFELWDRYASALIAGDIERWIALWIREGIELTATGLLYSGSEQIREVWQPVMDLFDMEVSIFLEDVRFLGACAYSYGSYRYAITPKEGGESINDSGLFLTILERQTDGSWKIAIDCRNYNAPQQKLANAGFKGF